MKDPNHKEWCTYREGGVADNGGTGDSANPPAIVPGIPCNCGVIKAVESSFSMPATARVAHGEVPILATPNTAQLTPAEQFSRDVRRVIGGMEE